MTDLVTRQDRDGAATLSLNRPEKLNSLNVELFIQLDDHVKRLAQETDTVGLVILRGAGWQELWVNAAVLSGMAVLVIALAATRFKKRVS